MYTKIMLKILVAMYFTTCSKFLLFYHSNQRYGIETVKRCINNCIRRKKQRPNRNLKQAEVATQNSGTSKTKDLQKQVRLFLFNQHTLQGAEFPVITYAPEIFFIINFFLYIFVKIKITRTHHNKIKNTNTWT